MKREDMPVPYRRVLVAWLRKQSSRERFVMISSEMALVLAGHLEEALPCEEEGQEA